MFIANVTLIRQSVCSIVSKRRHNKTSAHGNVEGVGPNTLS